MYNLRLKRKRKKIVIEKVGWKFIIFHFICLRLKSNLITRSCIFVLLSRLRVAAVQTYFPVSFAWLRFMQKFETISSPHTQMKLFFHFGVALVHIA